MCIFDLRLSLVQSPPQLRLHLLLLDMGGGDQYFCTLFVRAVLTPHFCFHYTCYQFTKVKIIDIMYDIYEIYNFVWMYQFRSSWSCVDGGFIMIPELFRMVSDTPILRYLNLVEIFRLYNRCVVCRRFFLPLKVVTFNFSPYIIGAVRMVFCRFEPSSSA